MYSELQRIANQYWSEHRARDLQALEAAYLAGKNSKESIPDTFPSNVVRIKEDSRW